jgi:hypothetical protein
MYLFPYILGTTGTTSLTSVSSTATGPTGTSGATTLLTTSGGVTSASSGTTLTTGVVTGTTTKACEEMQAVNEATSKKITVTPVDIPEGQKSQFQPNSSQGVSFPSYEKTPTITIKFGKPAEVHSITIPRDKTPDANVQQFQVTFYSSNGSKINPTPIQSTTSLTYEKNKPARLDTTHIPSETLVSYVEITIVQTTNGESPKGVILDIKACTEITTGECFHYFHNIFFNTLYNLSQVQLKLDYQVVQQLLDKVFLLLLQF